MTNDRIMNKWLIVLLCVFILAACDNKRILLKNPTSGWDGRQGSLKKLWQEQEFQPTYFQFKASASMEQGGKRTDFQLELRMLQDSIVWINISDPILGIPLVRAFLTPDSFAMINKLEKSYQNGGRDKARELLGLDIPFSELQAVLWANFPASFDLDSVQLLSKSVLALYPNRHELNSELIMLDPLMEAGVWKPAAFAIGWTNTSDRLLLRYQSYRQEEGYRYPEEWQIDLMGSSPSRLLLRVKEPSLEKTRFPFKIPSSYKRMP